MPDFYLPDNDRWIEIKGKKLSKTELEKCELFCEAQDEKGIKFSIIIGQPIENIIGVKSGNDPGTVALTSNPEEAVITGITVFSYRWKTYDITTPNGETRHIDNDTIMFAFDDLCEENVLTRFIPAMWHDENISTKSLINGAIAARQARFEHGEIPKGGK